MNAAIYFGLRVDFAKHPHFLNNVVSVHERIQSSLKVMLVHQPKGQPTQHRAFLFNLLAVATN